MRFFKHPATVIATVALFIAVGGGTAAYASGLINGSQIKNHSIAAKKLTNSAVKSLRGKRGPAGAQGTPGAPGAPGAPGPGGKIVTFDATATSTTPTPTPLGTFLGDTISAQCVSDGASGAETVLNLLTSDGSWNVDYSEVEEGTTNSTFAGSISAPAGTITSPAPFDLADAATGGHQQSNYIVFTQLGPTGGSMVWYAMATTNTTNPTCHVSIEYFPETITALHGAAHKNASHGPYRLGNLTLHLGA